MIDSIFEIRSLGLNESSADTAHFHRTTFNWAIVFYQTEMHKALEEKNK
jgi:hypothetical protein